MSRRLKIGVDRATGTIHNVVIVVADAVVAAGLAPQNYEGDISDSPTPITINVVGVADSKFKLTVNVDPGTKEDFSATFPLKTTATTLEFEL